jgi:hypothetical protein
MPRSNGGSFLPPIGVGGRDVQSCAQHPRSRGNGGPSRRRLSALSDSRSNCRSDSRDRARKASAAASGRSSAAGTASRQRQSRRQPRRGRVEPEPEPEPELELEPEPEPEPEPEQKPEPEPEQKPSWHHERVDSPPRAAVAVSFAANPFLHSSCYASVDCVIEGMVSKAERGLVQERGSAVLAALAEAEPAQAISVVRQHGLSIVTAAATAFPEHAASVVKSLSRLVLASIRAIECSQGVADDVKAALEAMLSTTEVAASREATASKSSAAELQRQFAEADTEVRTLPSISS